MATINAKLSPNSPKIRWGAMCRAPSINVPQYLLYLQARAKTLGVEVIKAHIPTEAGFENALTQAEATAQSHGPRQKVDLFLNATGLSAAKLCNDTGMYPIRGQTVLVRGEATATRTRNGDTYVAYCIPRPGSGTTILGGTKEKGIWSEKPDSSTTEKILQRATLLAPELLTGPDGGFEVVSVQCGLRPGRHGGPRMEKEVVGGRKVVHAYGHASGGYQNSIGSARLVVNLVNESLGIRSSSGAKL
jgi:glycine/D-amino acid oxidase-like deaminating enzyme